MIEPGHDRLSVNRQCGLVGLPRSSWYYRPCGERAENLALMCRLDELYTAYPFYGVRRMTASLQREGWVVNPKRVRRLLRLMGLMAVYPKPRLSLGGAESIRYPYLLRGLAIVRPNQVWATDITFIRMHLGFVYLTAILDWFSRYVLAWELSVSLDAEFCIAALEAALCGAQPEIFNSDQGTQFTSGDFTQVLLDRKIGISWDGRGRVFDNIFVERLWRSVKYEEVYLKDYADVRAAAAGLRAYFRFYNTERPHQSLGYATPAEVYFGPQAGRSQLN